VRISDAERLVICYNPEAAPDGRPFSHDASSLAAAEYGT